MTDILHSKKKDFPRTHQKDSIDIKKLPNAFKCQEK